MQIVHESEFLLRDIEKSEALCILSMKICNMVNIGSTGEGYKAKSG